MTDVWLLSHYSVATLATQGLPESCCVKGLLPEDEAWRCELDWPSSDVPPCSFWLDVREQVEASVPAQARNATTNANLKLLGEWAAKKENCSGTKSEN